MQLVCPESKGCQLLSLLLTLWVHNCVMVSEMCLLHTFRSRQQLFFSLPHTPVRHWKMMLCYSLSFFPYLRVFALFFIFLPVFLLFQAALQFSQCFAKVWFCLVFFKLLFLTWPKCPLKPHFNALGSWWHANLCAMNHSSSKILLGVVHT